MKTAKPNVVRHRRVEVAVVEDAIEEARFTALQRQLAVAERVAEGIGCPASKVNALLSICSCMICLNPAALAVT